MVGKGFSLKPVYKCTVKEGVAKVDVLRDKKVVATITVSETGLKIESSCFVDGLILDSTKYPAVVYIDVGREKKV
jgi:hypothetical protein